MLSSDELPIMFFKHFKHNLGTFFPYTQSKLVQQDTLGFYLLVFYFNN